MIEVLNKTKNKPPISGLLFKKIKEAAIGKKYSLSIVLVGNSLSRKINLKYRGKNKPTNVLSFEVSEDSGEIFLNLPLIKAEAARDWQTSYKNFFTYLLIHGLLHLKGLDHSASMTKKEKNLLKKFKVNIEI